MKNYSILVVDDETLIRKTIGADLKDKGYNVSLAENGETAIEMLKEVELGKKGDAGASAATSGAEDHPAQFDLVITDLVMEGTDGMEVLKEAKEKHQETQVIILTGYGNLDSAIEALRLKADDYLLKPCSEDELHFRVVRCLERLEYQRKIKLFENILPVCCVCKNIRDDTAGEQGSGDWMPMEVYMHNKTNIDVTHTYCPKCSNDLMSQVVKHF